MTSTFPKAVAFVLDKEKWKSNNQKDPGGYTIWGFSTRWFPEEVKKMDTMTMEQSREYATVLYQKMWTELGCDTLPYPIDWLAFDCRVNQGPVLAKSLAKRYADNWRDFLIARIKAYVDLPGQVLEGWPNRCFDLWKQVKEA